LKTDEYLRLKVITCMLRLLDFNEIETTRVQGIKYVQNVFSGADWPQCPGSGQGQRPSHQQEEH